MLIKYLLVEEMEDEEVLFQMYGGKRAKKHLMFELRNEEGLFQELIANHLREDYNKFATTRDVSQLHKDLILFIGKLGSHDDADTPSNSNVRLRLRLYSPPSRATIRSQR